MKTIVGDIGGTKTQLALFTATGGELETLIKQRYTSA